MTDVLPLTCDHDYHYAGVRFQVQPGEVPGSGARYVHFFDYYVCRKCLNGRAVKLNYTSTTYRETPFGATPLPREATT